MTRRTTATAVLMVATLMDLMDSTITNVALPTMRADLGATPVQLEWTLVGYVVAFAALLITGGRLGDIFGRRTMFLIGIIGFTAASAAASLASGANMLIGTRVIQGAFAGIMVPQVLSSVQVMYRPEERGPIFGIIGALGAIGAIAGLLLGGWLVTANLFGTGWRSIFLINVPIGVMLAIATWIWVPESRSTHPIKLDVMGTLLGTASVVLLVLPLTDGRAAGWAWWIWLMLATAPMAMGLFVWQQRYRATTAGTQLLPLPLFTIRSFSSGLLVQVISSMGHGGFALVLLFHLQSEHAFTPFQSGLALLPIGLGSILGAPIAMLLMKQIGRWAVLLGGLMQAGAYIWVIQVFTSTGPVFSTWSLVPPLALAGVGMIVLIMPQTSIALAEIPSDDAGAASGALTTFGQVGMVMGIALAGTAYFDTTPAAMHNVTAGLMVIVIAYAVSGVAAIAMPAIDLTDVNPAPI